MAICHFLETTERASIPIGFGFKEGEPRRPTNQLGTAVRGETAHGEWREGFQKLHCLGPMSLL
ncbi:Myosin-1 [Gossypium arboreum]|uniref:Myosin-1 n=1 Tax=Gossypium arboreum TaxID=29729 RepID=A0A0B0PB85_GOSAR|nr:Myosin-1 [Gossypium arboreum]